MNAKMKLALIRVTAERDTYSTTICTAVRISMSANVHAILPTRNKWATPAKNSWSATTVAQIMTVDTRKGFEYFFGIINSSLYERVLEERGVY